MQERYDTVDVQVRSKGRQPTAGRRRAVPVSLTNHPQWNTIFPIDVGEKIGMRRDSMILIGVCYATLLVCVSGCSVFGKAIGKIVGGIFGISEAGEGIGEGIGIIVCAGLCLPLCLGLIARLDKVMPYEVAPNPYADGTSPEHGLDTVVVNHNKSCRINVLEECGFRG